MAATTGATFLNLLGQILNRGNMSGSAIAYYSFYSGSGQTNEFIYNNLYPENYTYLLKVGSVTIDAQGSGYGLTEVPNMAFVSYDAGTGASGTAVMQSINDVSQIINTSLKRVFQFNLSGANLVNNGDFSSANANWAYVSTGVSGQYAFSGNQLWIYSGIRLVPNSDTLGFTGSTYYFGQFDIVSGLTGDNSGWFDCDATRNSSGYTKINPIQLNGKSGTITFGGWVTSSGSFYPTFLFTGNGQRCVIDNVKFYTGYSIGADIISNIASERFYWSPDSSGNYFEIGNGKTGAAFLDISGSNTKWKGDSTYPVAQTDITENWTNYSLSFWHKLERATSSQIILGAWPNFQLQSRYGKYGILCTASNTYLTTNNAITGDWHHIAITVKQYYNGSYPPSS